MDWPADAREFSRPTSKAREKCSGDDVDFTQVFVVPSIGFFASRLNFQTKPCTAWHPDPGAFAIDVFSVSRGNIFRSTFPPFYLIYRVLQKVEASEASGILIVPQ